jgi:hypothetical protein
VHRARRLTCLAIAAVVATTPAARAQVRPVPGGAHGGRVRDALSGEALTAFDRASLLFASHNFGPARAEFQRAHDLSHEPRVLYNAAVCDKELGRYGRAIATLRQSLSEGGPGLPRTYVSTVNDTIALLAPLVTTLAIDASVPGASVLVDGEVVGTTPLPAPASVDVGEHDVAVRKSGFVDFTQHISAVGGRPVAVRVSLEPLIKEGELVVRATGGAAGVSASVVVDGTDVGNAPWRGGLPAGVHVVGVRASGFSAAPRQVEVQGGQSTELGFALAPDARLRLTIDDDAAVVRLDGAVLGRGSFDGPVPSGEHQLVVARLDGGGTPFRTELALERGETRSMSIQIHHGGELTVWLWVGGGVIVAGAITAGVLLLTASKKFEGSSPGTLNPSLIPTGLRLGAW